MASGNRRGDRVFGGIGEGGDELFLGETIDILICDIGMPEMDGYSLMRSIRMLDDPQKGEIPAVALTAYARSEDHQASGYCALKSIRPFPASRYRILICQWSRKGKAHPLLRR